MRASFADPKPARHPPEGVNIFPPEGINMRSHKLACPGTNTAGPAGTQEHELHFDQTRKVPEETSCDTHKNGRLNMITSNMGLKQAQCS
jgi:hypothetical protein